MLRADVTTILEIDEATHGDPWSEEDLLTVLRGRNNIGQVIEAREEVVGYLCYQLFKDRMAIARFGIDKPELMESMGSILIDKLKQKLTPGKRTKLVTIVRDSDLAAQIFYRDHGFRATAVLKRYWRGDTDEDGYRLEYRLAWQHD